MRFSIFISFLLLLLHSCTERNNKTKSKENIPKENHGILISSNQISSANKIKINNCEFEITIDDTDTTFLGTSDLNFTTPEGYRVGLKVKDLPIQLQKQMIKESGWGYYIPLNSNWNLGFCEGKTCTENIPTIESKIKWIFKRNQNAH